MKGTAIDPCDARVEFGDISDTHVIKIRYHIDRALEYSGLTVDPIDPVFITGGSAYAPVARQILVDTGEGMIRTGDAFISVAAGPAGSREKSV